MVAKSYFLLYIFSLFLGPENGFLPGRWGCKSEALGKLK